MIACLQSLVHSWKACLAPLKQANIRNFFLEVLRTTQEIYRILLRYAWWVVGLLILSFVVSPAAVTVLQMLLFFVTLCAARSSVGTKNAAYFAEKAIYFFIAYWFLNFLVMRAFDTVNPVLLKTGGVVLIQAVLLHCSAFLTLSGLFLIDSGLWLYSIIESPIRAFRMLIYNYPVFLGVEICRMCISILLTQVISTLFDFNDFSFFVGEMVNLGMWFIYVPFYVALVSTLYIRRVYEQGKYY